MTFIGGPRACIGFRFSLVEYVTLFHSLRKGGLTVDVNARMKALLFMLIRSFEFELALPKEAITKLPGIVDRPFLKAEEAKGAMLPLKIKNYVRAE